MTKQEWADIWLKEVITIADIQKMYVCNYNQASALMQKIRIELTKGMGKELRLTVQGKIHKQDYLDWRNRTKGA